jgi:hypothetical protein
MMKVRLLIWAVTLAMVVGAVVLLARRERAASAADSGDTREDLFEFAGRMDERLAAFERQLAEALDSLPAGAAEADWLHRLQLLAGLAEDGAVDRGGADLGQ